MNIKSEKNVDWLLICQHCRLEKCREAGMKDDYVHNLRLHVSTLKIAGNVFLLITIDDYIPVSFEPEIAYSKILFK